MSESVSAELDAPVSPCVELPSVVNELASELSSLPAPSSEQPEVTPANKDTAPKSTIRPTRAVVEACALAVLVKVVSNAEVRVEIAGGNFEGWVVMKSSLSAKKAKSRASEERSARSWTPARRPLSEAPHECTQ